MRENVMVLHPVILELEQNSEIPLFDVKNGHITFTIWLKFVNLMPLVDLKCKKETTLLNSAVLVKLYKE